MKNFGGIKTRYLLDGTNIIAQEVTNGDSLDYIYFFYDASGSPVGMNYLGYNYYYKKNLQGDIIEIWGTEDGTDNHTFRCLVKYVYDAWGNILQMNDTTDGWFKVGTANPFRYRGYYYDNESGFYYLQSRYYDPVTGRFLNADDTAYLGHYVGEAILAVYKVVGGSIRGAKGNGFVIELGKLTLRIMTSGGCRTNYMRISHMTKGALTILEHFLTAGF